MNGGVPMSIDFPDVDELKADGWQDVGYVDSIGWVKVTSAKEYSLTELDATWTSRLLPPRIAASHECPHCFRQTHPEPLTATQAEMYDTHVFDPRYDPAADNSRIVCIGADYQGPMTASGSNYAWTPTIIFDSPMAKMQKMLQGVQELWKSLSLPSFTVNTWLPGDDQFLPVGEPEKCPTDPDKLPIKFNDPENWKPWERPKKEWYPVSPALDIKWEQWHESFPVPDCPGYDFSKFDDRFEFKSPKKGRKK